MRATPFLTLLPTCVVLITALVSGRSLQAREEVKVKHILVSSEAEAAQIRSEIVASGGDRKAFSAACRKYSRDPYTKPLGGNLQWFSRISAMDAGVKTAAFEMEDSEVSAPVQSEYGWHLLYMIGRRDRDRKAPNPVPTKRSTPTPIM